VVNNGIPQKYGNTSVNRSAPLARSGASDSRGVFPLALFCVVPPENLEIQGVSPMVYPQLLDTGSSISPLSRQKPSDSRDCSQERKLENRLSSSDIKGSLAVLAWNFGLKDQWPAATMSPAAPTGHKTGGQKKFRPPVLCLSSSSCYGRRGHGPALRSMGSFSMCPVPYKDTSCLPRRRSSSPAGRTHPGSLSSSLCRMRASPPTYPFPPSARNRGSRPSL
jgi:hypothetical protein